MDLIKALKESKRLVVGGHRGQLVEGIRENTITAFETVLDKGIPYVEVDVQLTKDRELVLYHDHDLSQKTSLTGMIRDYDLHELRSSFEICTVAEAIDWAKVHDIGLAFELKLKSPEMVADRLSLGLDLVKLLKTKNFVQQCFVFAKDLDLLQMMKKEEADLPLGVICIERPDDPVQFMIDMKADIYLNFLGDLSQDLVTSLQAAGFLVDGSVVNTQNQLDQALSLGVNMVESDFPEQLLRLLEDEK